MPVPGEDGWLEPLYLQVLSIDVRIDLILINIKLLEELINQKMVKQIYHYLKLNI